MREEPGSGRRTWALSVVREVEGDVLVVTIAGRLGTAASADVIETLVEAIRGGHLRIACDLTRVDYASSAGLLALDAVNGRMHAAGGRIVLCGLAEPVRLALEFAGLLSQFAVADSREAAIACLRNGAAAR